MGIVGLMTGAGAGQGLKEVLAQRLQEQILRQRQLEAEQGYGLDERRLAADEERNRLAQGQQQFQNDLALENVDRLRSTAMENQGEALSKTFSQGDMVNPQQRALFKATNREHLAPISTESVDDAPIPVDVAVSRFKGLPEKDAAARSQGPLKLMGPGGKPVYRIPTEDELKTGAPAYDEPNQGPRPYFMPVTAIPGGQTTPQVYVLDARTGQLTAAQAPGQPGPMQPRLSGTEQTKTNEMATAIKSADMIRQAYSADGRPHREFIGPAAGRWTTLKSKLPASGMTQLPQGWAGFASAVANNKNATIKAITGAQMSEPEAKRLMLQIPDIPDRPEVFEAKLAMLDELNSYVFSRWARAEQMRQQGVPPASIQGELDRAMGPAPAAGGAGKQTPEAPEYDYVNGQIVPRKR